MTDSSSGERIVHANGVDLCIETFGEPTAPPILLIHGGGSQLIHWDAALCARLAAGGRFVVRYDNRDCGRSTTFEVGNPTYALPDLVADAVGLLDALDLPRAHIVGLSQGGGIGQLLALDHPDRVATLTLETTTPGGPGHDHPDLPGMAQAVQDFFAGDVPEPDWTDRDAAIDYLVLTERPFAGSAGFDEAASRAVATQVVDRASDIAANMTNPFILDAGPPWRNRLGTITAPTLVVHGADDPLFPLAHAEASAREIPGARLLVLDGVGHEYPPRQTWDTLVPAILEHTAG